MLSIGVFGSSLPREGSPAYEEAREIGREIARRGARVVCGGYGGVMEAVCRGATEEGGESLGVLISGAGSPNPWVTRSESEPDLAARLRRLRDESDAAIFLPHGLGTMLEIIFLAESIVKGAASLRPLVFLGGFWRDTVEKAAAEAAGQISLASSVSFAATPAEAVSRAFGERP